MEKFFQLIRNVIFQVIKAIIILIICIFVLFSWLGVNPLVVLVIYGFILFFPFWLKENKSRLEKERAEQEQIEAKQEQKKREYAERIECAKQERIKLENERIEHRDSDSQDKPYLYECKGHPNVTLAIRHGIANLSNIKNVPADTIKLQKVKKIKDDPEGSHYLAKLIDFGNRKVIVVIEPGTEYVKTFYPMSEDWFNKYADLELVLKDNSTFSLKELANFHVQKVVINS